MERTGGHETIMNLTFAPKLGTIVPDMSTDKVDPLYGLSAALFGKARRHVLALLYGHADESFYLRQIVRAVNLGQGAIQRELAHLTATGIVLRRRQGNQIYFQANRACPIFSELKALVIKTSGVVEVLRTALANLRDQITVAFVYGSLATGAEKSASDVDLMVIGEVTSGGVARILQDAQTTLAREINPTVYPPDEYRKKIKAGHHFLKSVINEPKLFVIGGERELAGLGQKQLAR